MNFRSMSDAAILQELGDRFRQQRLNLNVSQTALAADSGVTRGVIQRIEQGADCSLTSVIKALRGLGLLDQLDAFLPAPGVSPIQLARMRGRERQRASRRKTGD